MISIIALVSSSLAILFTIVNIVMISVIRRLSLLTVTNTCKEIIEGTDRSKEQLNGNPYMKWVDILASIPIDYWISATLEKQRLVDSGILSSNEYSELCSFTGRSSTDRNGRLRWCKSHRMIVYHGRSEGSQWFYDSPVDHILVLYNSTGAEVRGYKDKKRVGTWNWIGDSYDDFQRDITDPLHVLDTDLSFLGATRNLDGTGVKNWIGKERGLWDGGDRIELIDD